MWLRRMARSVANGGLEHRLDEEDLCLGGVHQQEHLIDRLEARLHERGHQVGERHALPQPERHAWGEWDDGELGESPGQMVPHLLIVEVGGGGG